MSSTCSASTGSSELLRVEGLRVEAIGPGGRRAAVLRGVDLEVRRGQVLAVVGESGCGKSTLALSLLRLLPPGLELTAGAVWLEGTNLLALAEEEMRRVRGSRLAMVFQEPLSALNPVLTVGFQLAEAVRLHRGARGREAWRRAVELARAVGFPPERLRSWPHQLSGGLRQRVAIALALAGRPQLLIADEPTTALDVTVELQVLELLQRLCQEEGISMLLISHDLVLVGRLAHRIAVLYGGQVVEEAPASQLLSDPLHPYAQALLRCRRELVPLPGSVPSPWDVPPGCPFRNRCPEANARCKQPPPARVREGRMVRCWRRE